MIERDGRGRIIVRPRPRRGSTLGQVNGVASAQPVDLPTIRTRYPTMWRALQTKGYQTLVPAFAKEVGNYFNASQPGCGKTIETLATLAELDKRGNILIVAPKKAIQATWPHEVEKWLAPDASVSVMACDVEQGTMAERNAMLGEFVSEPPRADFRFVLIHPEMMSWDFVCGFVAANGKKCNGKSKTCPNRSKHEKVPNYPNLFKITWDAIVMDETHKFMMNANPRSGSVSGWGYGSQKLKVRKGCLKIGMSGTPFKGKPRKFYPTLRWLNSIRWSSQHRWEQHYFETEADFFARSGTTITDKMYPHREKEFEQELDSFMIRHTKSELRLLNPSWAPPQKVHVDVRLKMTPRQKKAYEGIIKDATAQLLNGSIDANGILAERTRLKQFASAYGQLRGERFAPALPSNKWEWIVEALEERGLVGKRGASPAVNDGNIKIVLASTYTSLLALYAEELERMGINYFSITGKTRNVRAIEADWQSDQTHTRVLLLGSASGGTSLTLDAADDLVHISESENPDENEQVEDRIHRTSRTDHQVTVYHLQSIGTIDESIASGNLLLDVSQKALLDGRRNVEFARLTLEGGKR